MWLNNVMDELKRRHTDTPIIVEMNPRPISPRKIVPTRGLSSAGNAAPDRKIVLRPTCRNATNCPWGTRRRGERLEVRKRLRGSGMAAQRVIRRFRGCGRDWHVMRLSTSWAVRHPIDRQWQNTPRHHGRLCKMAVSSIGNNVCTPSMESCRV